MNLTVDMMSNWMGCSNCNTVFEIMAHMDGMTTFWLRNVANIEEVFPVQPFCPKCRSLLAPTGQAKFITADKQHVFSIPFPPPPTAAQN